MTKRILLAGVCLAISGCNGSSNDGESEAADGVSAEAQVQLPTSSDMNGDGFITMQETEAYTLALVDFEPGLWSFESVLEPVDGSIPLQIVQMLRQNVEFIRTECVTGDSVPGQNIYNPGIPADQAAAMLRYQSYTLQDGSLSAVVNQSQGGVDQTSTITGTLAPAALTIRFEDAVRVAQLGPQEIRVAYNLAGQRVGDC